MPPAGCAGATLTFNVELLNIGDAAPTTNVFKEIDSDKDNQLSREEVSDGPPSRRGRAGAEAGR